MKSLTVKCVACLLLAAIVAPLLAPGANAANVAAPDTIRVGLAYGGGALPGANLENSTGSGYRLGYTENGVDFIQVAVTYETKLSVVKTQNVYYDGKNYVNSASGPAVGSYHIRLPQVYGSGEEAQAAAIEAGGFPFSDGMAYYVQMGAYLSLEEANLALETLGIEGATVAGTGNGGMSVVVTGTSDIIFQFDNGSNQGMLMILPGVDDSVKTSTWFAGLKFYGAFRYQRIGGGDLTVVNVVNRDDYINCVVSQEMSESWPLEALKAQAVAARGFALTSATKHQSYGFDVCSTTDCQAYTGTGRVGPNTTRAAEETTGQYVWYDGKPAATYYFSSDGGATENSENVWVSKLPHIRGIEDPWEATVIDDILRSRKNYFYTVTYTKAELEQRLREKKYTNITDLVGVSITPTEMGNVRSITFTDRSGKTQTVYGDSARTLIYPSGSIRFTLADGNSNGAGGGYYIQGADQALTSLSDVYAVDGSGNVSKIPDGAYVITGTGTEELTPSTATGSTQADSYTFTGAGYGHNLGMSQWGAYAMAKAGKTYDEILKFYYTGVEVY